MSDSGRTINPATVSAHFGPDISGAEIREIVRRAVLLHGEVSEPELINTVRSGRFRAQLPDGTLSLACAHLLTAGLLNVSVPSVRASDVGARRYRRDGERGT